MLTDINGNPIKLNEVEDVGEFTPPAPGQEQVQQDITKSPEDQALEEAEAAAAAEAASKVTFTPPTDDLLDDDQIEEEDQVVDETGGEEEDKDKSPDTILYEGLGSIFKEKGLFSEDAEIKSEADFMEAFDTAVSNKLEAQAKEIQTYMKAGLPYEAVAQVQQAINTVAAVTEEDIKADPELAKNLIVGEFKNKGFSDEDSLSYYETFKSAGIDVQEALKAKASREAGLKNVLKTEVEKAQNAKIQAQVEREENAKKLAESLKEGKILGRTITDNTAKKLENVLNTVVGYSPTGEPLNAYMKYKEENPVDFEKYLLYLFTVTEGFDNLKAFDRSAQTRVSNTFRTAVSTISSGKSFVDKSTSPNKHSIDMNTIDDIV